MRRLAADLGMKAPSLYKHFPDKEALELELIVVGFEESAARVRGGAREPAAVADRRAGVRRIARTRRAHPHVYRLMTDRPLARATGCRWGWSTGPRRRSPKRWARVAAARAAWALAHGLVMLEINGRFPADADVDAAWEAGITALERIRQS